MPRLRCELVTRGRYAPGDAVRLRFALVNDGATALHVLRWYTPLEGLLGDVLAVRRDGGPRLVYLGPKMKRGDPSAAEYLRLEPGERTASELELAAAYDVAAPGAYVVRFDGALADVVGGEEAAVPRPRGRHRPVTINACEARFEVR
jgi:peptidyl-Lys metalloendopeptidase